MKKSHIITYISSMILMLVSYVLFITVYLTESSTLYQHSYHLFGIILILVPFLFEIIFKRELPLMLIIGYYIFVFIAQIIGSAYDGYSIIPCLDIIAHGFSALLVVMFIAYISPTVLNKTHWAYQLLYLVACAVFVGVIWEIIEYCGDVWFGMNNQIYKDASGLFIGQKAIKDTMVDLISDTIGAVVGALIVVFTNKYYLNSYKRAKDEKDIQH